MNLLINVGLTYEVFHKTDALIQIEVAQTPEQHLSADTINATPRLALPIPGESDIGVRRWLETDTSISCEYTARVGIARKTVELESLSAVASIDLDGEATRYLLPSRYCDVDLFNAFAQSEFSGLEGGSRVAAIARWTEDSLAYVPGTSDSRTTASDTFVAREGICRDYAHVFIALVRASGIPARFVSCYAPDVSPPDFHAVAEVWLDGAWWMVDPSGMSQPHETAVIGVGRDAADVAFLTTFGPARFVKQFVRINRCA